MRFSGKHAPNVEPDGSWKACLVRWPGSGKKQTGQWCFFTYPVSLVEGTGTFPGSCSNCRDGCAGHVVFIVPVLLLRQFRQCISAACSRSCRFTYTNLALSKRQKDLSSFFWSFQQNCDSRWTKTCRQIPSIAPTTVDASSEVRNDTIVIPDQKNLSALALTVLTRPL